MCPTFGWLNSPDRIPPDEREARAIAIAEVRSRLGASIPNLINDELQDVECRVISGSILSGRRATGAAGYLGRYHLQVSALAEGRERELLGWLVPGTKRVSASRAFLSSLFRRRRFPTGRRSRSFLATFATSTARPGNAARGAC